MRTALKIVIIFCLISISRGVLFASFREVGDANNIFTGQLNSARLDHSSVAFKNEIITSTSQIQPDIDSYRLFVPTATSRFDSISVSTTEFRLFESTAQMMIDGISFSTQSFESFKGTATKSIQGYRNFISTGENSIQGYRNFISTGENSIQGYRMGISSAEAKIDSFSGSISTGFYQNGGSTFTVSINTARIIFNDGSFYSSATFGGGGGGGGGTPSTTYLSTPSIRLDFGNNDVYVSTFPNNANAHWESDLDTITITNMCGYCMGISTVGDTVFAVVRSTEQNSNSQYAGIDTTSMTVTTWNKYGTRHAPDTYPTIYPRQQIQLWMQSVPASGTLPNNCVAILDYFKWKRP